MKSIAKDFSYRIFYIILAVVIPYFLPMLANIFSELMAAVFLPLLENTIQNMSNN